MHTYTTSNTQLSAPVAEWALSAVLAGGEFDGEVVEIIKDGIQVGTCQLNTYKNGDPRLPANEDVPGTNACLLTYVPGDGYTIEDLFTEREQRGQFKRLVEAASNDPSLQGKAVGLSLRYPALEDDA